MYVQMNKIGHLYADYWLTELYTFPENEWFAPTNKSVEHYSICDSLSRLNLICKKVIPHWVNGSFKGNHVYFKYNKELKIGPSESA